VGLGGGKDQRFNGSIQDARVYSRVLTQSEISAMSLTETLDIVAAKRHRTESESNALHWFFLDHAAPGPIREVWKRLATARESRERLERTFPTVMVMADSPVPKQSHVLIRGAYDKPGEKVEPGLPAILPPLPDEAPRNRLGLARWMVSPDNPLLARVTLNRLWQTYFGTGIVKTVEDFGLQGESPYHPELLDWLAVEFMRSGWNLKRMSELIVTSATYRQSSRAPEDLLQRDPDNRLLARGPRVRLAAEMIRDHALSVSGLLQERIGGPSVKPYQPAGLWNELIMQDMEYVQSKGPDLYRRGIYTFWKRTVAPPMMVNFDAANREACVVRENRTNTPLQALNLMNDVTFVEAARFAGQRMMKEAGPGRLERLRYGFQLITGRAPVKAEEAVLEGSLAYHLDYFANGAKAASLLSVGDTRSDPALPPRELAAYTSVASLIMNLDESMTKE
jgi:hypothetical protein